MTLALWCLAIGCVLPYVWSMATFPGRFQEGALDSHHPRSHSIWLGCTVPVLRLPLLLRVNAA